MLSGGACGLAGVACGGVGHDVEHGVHVDGGEFGAVAVDGTEREFTAHHLHARAPH